MCPAARGDDAIVAQQVQDEFVVYDLERHEVHSLNATAARIWQWCDGRTSQPVLAKRLAREFALSEQQAGPLLALTLNKLNRAKLLEDGAAQPVAARRQVNRRRVLQIVGAATLLPAIYTMVAPIAAHAQSAALGATCINNNSQCIGGLGTCFTQPGNSNCTCVGGIFTSTLCAICLSGAMEGISWIPGTPCP